jgi:serine/threonine protein kinase
MEHSMVSSARQVKSRASRKASFGGDLGFDLKENSMCGSHSAQSSISVNGYEQINQYELSRLLGKGSFADVYLGVDTESEEGTMYAVKVLSSKKIKKRLLLKKSSQILDAPEDEEEEGGKPASLADLFMRNEVAILKKVSHQYITKLHDVIVDNPKQKVYLVLEYCSGGFINESKTQKGQYCKLMESECKRYCKQLAQAF